MTSGSMSQTCDRENEHLVNREVPAYEDLEDATRQIRLLRFTSAPGADVVACELCTYWLDNAPLYRGISYTWGGNHKSASISIDGRKVAVRKSCFWALWQANNCFEHAYIWIDALCVNQTNLVEKGCQVQLMGQIFSRAVDVSISLGPDVEIIQDMVCTIRTVVEQLDAAEPSQFGTLDTWIDNHDAVQIRRFDAALHALSHRDYWRRAWIVQELMVAPTINVFYGSKSIGLALFTRLYECLIELQVSYSTSFRKYHRNTGRVPPPEGSEPMWKILSTLGRGKMSFRDVVWEYHRCLCANPLDKIYAFLYVTDWSKTTSSDGRPLLVDYTKTPYELLCECLQYVLEPGQNRPSDDWMVVQYLMKSLQLDEQEQNVRRLIEERRGHGPVVKPAASSCLSVTSCSATTQMCSLLLPSRFQFHAASCIRSNRLGTLTAALYSHSAADSSPELVLWNLDMATGSIVSGEKGIAGYICEAAKEGDLLLQPPEPFLGPDHHACLVVREDASRAIFRIVGYAAVSPLWSFCRSQGELSRLHEELRPLALTESSFEGAFSQGDLIAYTALRPPYKEDAAISAVAQHWLADLMTTSFTVDLDSSFVMARKLSRTSCSPD